MNREAALRVLIEADREVIKGLRLFDAVAETEWAKTEALLREKGGTDEEVETFRAAQNDRVDEARDDLHRKMWAKALADPVLDELRKTLCD